MASTVSAAPARDCGTCSLCCKLLGIRALDKPAGSWCPNCTPAKGCGIYETRPQECRDFSCGWLENARLGEEWKPINSHIILYIIDNGARLVAHVDTGAPDAWRKEPFYSTLKGWARRGIRGAGPQVVVRHVNRHIVMLPDRDVDLGILRKGDTIFIGERMTPQGMRYVAEKAPAPEPA